MSEDTTPDMYQNGPACKMSHPLKPTGMHVNPSDIGHHNAIEEREWAAHQASIEKTKHHRSMTDTDIEALADAIHERMAKAVLALPAEFKKKVIKQWQSPPMQIPVEKYRSDYYLLHFQITKTGSMVFYLRNVNGELVKQWVME